MSSSHRFQAQLLDLQAEATQLRHLLQQSQHDALALAALVATQQKHLLSLCEFNSNQIQHSKDPIPKTAAIDLKSLGQLMAVVLKRPGKLVWILHGSFTRY